MTSAVFDRQIKELSIRTLAYHEKCQGLWTKQPPAPHYGAPFLFAYVWSTWTVADRRKLIEAGRASVEQNISSMLAQGGQTETNKMSLLLACCVPEIFQDELYEELRPMAQLLSLIWKLPTKTDRQSALVDRPKHISSEMAFIDNLPFVWAQPTVKLIEQTLQLLNYKVFDDSTSRSAALSPADNEMYQRDLLLSLRAFWMTYFGLQIFMNLSDHFHRTEEMLLAKQRAQEAANAADAPPQPAYRKPIHVMKIGEDMVEDKAATSSVQIEEIVDEAIATATASTASAAASASSIAATAADPFAVPSSVPASVYCAECRISPMAALLSVTGSPNPVSPLDPASIAANKQARVIDLKRCARCKEVFYCSVECQRKHLKKHKVACKRAAAALAAVAASTPPAAATEDEAPAVDLNLTVD